MSPQRRRNGVLAFSAVAALGCEPLETPVGAWDPEVRASLYLEAEDAELAGGFSVAEDPQASAGRYLLPPPGRPLETEPGTGRARYEFSLPADGNYRLWGRIRSPDAVHNRFWLGLDAEPLMLWRISVGDIWFWDDVHEDADYGNPLVYSLPRGAHVLVVANAVDEVALDRLYFTAEGDEPPGNDTSCDPPHTISIGGECLPSCGTLSGTACGEVECSGLPPLPAYDCDVCCHLP